MSALASQGVHAPVDFRIESDLGCAKWVLLAVLEGTGDGTSWLVPAAPQ